MKKLRPSYGSKNVIGKRIKQLRKENKLSQRDLSYKFQIKGIDIDKNVITRIETGKRFVNDFEVKAFSEIFNVTTDSLFEDDK